MTYHFQVHRNSDGLWAECLELSGCRTEAESEEQLKTACAEALNLYLEEPSDSKMVFPLPSETFGKDVTLLKVPVEPEIAFAVLLRFYRSNARMTQKQVSEMLGMKNVYSYQRLEKKSNPSLNLIKKIRGIFPDIKLETIFQ
jgi:DNA-binding XRE family transcriptional regulator/predicted RNase H-like HicB family nuclease